MITGQIFKKINIAELVYSIAFALMTVISRHTSYSDKVESSILTVNIGKMSPVDILIFAVVVCAVYVLLQVIRVGIKKIGPHIIIKNDNNTGKPVEWAIIFAVIMVCYIPYLMSYWPGGIYNDTSYTIDIALGRSPMSNQNTVLYALFWRLIFFIGQVVNQGDYGGLKLMTILQCAAIAAVAASFITWLGTKGIRRWIMVILTAIVALCPIFPYYGISLWKETWFGLSFFLYTWMWYEIASNAGHTYLLAGGGDHVGSDTDIAPPKMKKKIYIYSPIRYVVLSLLIIFGRNNGIYVVLLTMLVSSVLLRKNTEKKTWERMIAVNITIIVIALIIQGPIYKAAGIEKSDPAENFGVPLQQTAYMISSSAVDRMVSDIEEDPTYEQSSDMDQIIKENLSMSDQQFDTITSIMPMGAWINLYNPVVVDSIKFGDYFDKDFFDTHTIDFIKAYTGMALKNPGLAIRGYLISTMGFWDAYKSSSSAYICTKHTSQSEYFMSDYFNVHTDMYLSDIVGPRWYMSGGALVWIMLGLLVLSVSSRCDGNKKTDPEVDTFDEGNSTKTNGLKIMTYIPGIALWLTYMLATPLSFSFRYVFGLLLCLPLYLGPVINMQLQCHSDNSME